MAYALTGRIKGGPAQTAVIGSAIMGSINGSAVANVVTTGTFTIPLMKQIGYKPHYAAAVEAVASTGGQIMPPIMGAAAFVMADMTGIPYSTIIIAAFVPALLFYLALSIQLRLEAGKQKMEILSDAEIPDFKKVLKEGYLHLIPLIILVYALLVARLSPTMAGIYAIGSVIAIGVPRALIVQHRFPLREIIESLKDSAQTAIPIAAACATAGMVIGVVSLTGLGVRFTQLVFSLSGGLLPVALVMIALACLILGMGLPSTAAYVIAAVVGSRALQAFGVSQLAANMFIFYFAILSFITPPVAIAAYAAAGLAKSDAMKTGFQAWFLGLAGYIVPFVFIYSPSLFLQGSSISEVVLGVSGAILGVCILSVAIEGWFIKTLSIVERLALFTSSLLIVSPQLFSDIIGLLILAVVIVKNYILWGHLKWRHHTKL